VRRILVSFLLAPFLAAQDPSAQPTPPKDAAVSGIVRDKGTGQPLANFNVFTDTRSKSIGGVIYEGAGSKRVESTTDASGRYRLSGLPADHYEIRARDSQRRTKEDVTRNIVVSGHDMDNVNFDIVLDGSIEGKVVDENGDAAQNVRVVLVAREYFQGNIGYYLQGFGGSTNDRGEYQIPNVRAGRAYLVLADSRRFAPAAVAETPLNSKLRRPVLRRTWYPNSPSGDGAAEIIVRPGEVRRGVDIKVKKSPSYCVEGATRVEGAATAMSLSVDALQPSSGLSSRGGIFGPDIRVTTGGDGVFRVCDLFPGAWRISTNNTQSGQAANGTAFGMTTVTIVDEDVKGLDLNALPGLPLTGDVVLDGTAPQKPITAQAGISLEPLFRARLGQGDQTYARADIPGTFALPTVLMDDYAAMFFLNGAGLYVKDILYRGQSVRNAPVHVAGVGDFRVVIGQDGAGLTASVTDKAGNPVPDRNVVIVPANVGSEAALAKDFVMGRTDQGGQYALNNLAPGRYYVAATEEAFDASASSIAKLWNSYRSFKEVELTPNSQAQVNLEPLVLAK
jgi:hypothetical protein